MVGVILIAAVLGPILCLALGRSRLVRLAGLAALVAVIAYPLTPLTACGPFGRPIGFHDNLRYAAAALTMALAMMAMVRTAGPADPAPDRVRWLCRRSGGHHLPSAPVELNLRPGRPEPRCRADPAHCPGRLPATVGRLRTAPAALLKVGIAAGALALGFTGVAIAYTGQKDYLHQRYLNKRGLFGIHQLWHWAAHLQHKRIALAGTFGWYFGYPLFGAHDNNTVIYMGHAGRTAPTAPSPRAARGERRQRRALRVRRGHGQADYVVACAELLPRGNWTRI